MILINKEERAVLLVIYNKCVGKEACLITPDEILSGSPQKLKLDKERLLMILKSLEVDDYFEFIQTDKNGEPYYCITLHAKGSAFLRARKQQVKSIYVKIAVIIGGAVLSFIVGRILIGIFA